MDKFFVFLIALLLFVVSMLGITLHDVIVSYNKTTSAFKELQDVWSCEQLKESIDDTKNDGLILTWPNPYEVELYKEKCKDD